MDALAATISLLICLLVFVLSVFADVVSALLIMPRLDLGCWPGSRSRRARDARLCGIQGYETRPGLIVYTHQARQTACRRGMSSSIMMHAAYRVVVLLSVFVFHLCQLVCVLLILWWIREMSEDGWREGQHLEQEREGYIASTKW